ncbi:MAG: MarR family transcriptional regulator [Methanocellales archaeon]|nr:MarR family transcriptional regulator [Methanocellales archaeon]
MKDLKKLFLREKPAHILLTIASHEKPYASTIAKAVDSTYAHITNILSEMEKHGLVAFSPQGRIKYVRLTDLGETVAGILGELYNVLGETKVPLRDEDVNRLRKKMASLTSKIDAIYREELKGKKSLTIKDATRISRRFGPYLREIGKIERHAVKSPEIKKEFEKIQKRMDELLQLREKLLGS